MKVRNDYVSNSSSSSFIVITNDVTNQMVYAIREKFKDYSNENVALEIPMDEYKHEFGWEYENTYKFGGKLNFVALQLLYLYCGKLNGNEEYGKKFDQYYEMTKFVCMKEFGIAIKLREELVRAHNVQEDDNGTTRVYYWMDYFYYIDHQSTIVEGECDEMFESETALYNFLASDNSYVEGGNDNYEPKDENVEN